MWDYIKTCHTNTIHYLDFSIYSQMESSVLKESFKLLLNQLKLSTELSVN